MPPGEDVARLCELHEGEAWCANVAACAALEGNPLAAAVERVGGVGVPVVAALDISLFNRVIGLSMRVAADEATVNAIARIYAKHNQENWSLSLSPLADDDVREAILAHGLRPGENFLKVVRSAAAQVPTVETALRIEKIGTDEAEAFAAVNVAAWRVRPAVAPWFSAAIGRPGWHHYLGFDGPEAVAAGALYVTEGFGWLGFGATLPTHRNRGGQAAIMARRIRDATALGCQILHTDTIKGPPGSPNASYRNMIRAGFEQLYVRPNYTTIPKAGTA